MPEPTTLLIAGASVAATEGLKLLTKEIYTSAQGQLQKRLKAWKNQTAIGNFHRHLHKVRLVKTLGQVDKPVDISKFYCESHVYVKNDRICITTVDDLPPGKNLLIEGIAGQGKSIFLRYLTAVELARGKFVPIFVELRNVKGNHLLDYILHVMKELKLDLDSELFPEFVQTGKIILFLDAFDEIDDAEKPRTISELEHLVNCNENLRVIVTSRPNNELRVSAKFDVVKLSDLKNEEYEKVIFRLLDDEATAAAIIKQIKAHQGGVRDLLLTPLLVTLLVINYKAFQQIPAQLSEFYDSLFQVLLQRHDGSKPGYTRKRLCDLNDTQYRHIFEALCYFTKKETRLDHPKAYACAKTAIAEQGFKEDPERFLKDIVRITCLLVRDGEEYRFIHKSVQEYYAAYFLVRKPDNTVREVYTKLFKQQFSAFHSELHFLSEIDAYRFAKYGLLPALARYLSVAQAELSELTLEAVTERVKNNVLNTSSFFITKSNDGLRYRLDGVATCTQEIQSMSLLPQKILKAAKDGLLEKGDTGPAEAEFPGYLKLSVPALYERGVLKEALDKVSREAAIKLLQRIKSALKIVEQSENSHATLELLP